MTEKEPTMEEVEEVLFYARNYIWHATASVDDAVRNMACLNHKLEEVAKIIGEMEIKIHKSQCDDCYHCNPDAYFIYHEGEPAPCAHCDMDSRDSMGEEHYDV